MNKGRKIALSFATALMMGFGVGAAVSSFADSAPQPASAPQAPQPSINAQPVQRNASGLAYGVSGLGARPADDPDLVLVVATNGKTGYAFTKELNGVQPKSPSEAAQIPKSWTVPVYLSDGKTQIGEFVVGQSKGTASVN